MLEPSGVAVDRSEDLLYVADTGNDRISVFDASSGSFIKAFGWGVADGTTNALQVCTTLCFKGIGGTAGGQIENAVGIAVDNDPTSPGYHDVYVFENSTPSVRLQKFTPAGQFVWTVGGKVNKTTEANLCTAASGDTCGAGFTGDGEGSFNRPGWSDVVAVGPGGTVHVADRLEGVSPRPSRVQRFSSAGGQLGQMVLPVTGGSGRATGLAVDSNGNFYVGTSGETGAARKYSAAGTELLAVDPSFNVTSLDIGPEGHLFVADVTGTASKILEYDSTTGALMRVFYGSLGTRAIGLVRYSTPEGDVIAVEQADAGAVDPNGRVVSIPFPEPGPIVFRRPDTVLASPIGNTKATIKSRVNPEGEATTYHFEYISDEDFKAASESFGAGTVKTPESGSIGADFELHSAEAQLTGLFPETTYHFRAVATNPSGEDVGPTGTFTTKEPVEFGALWTTDVDTDSATLHAEANPLGIPSTARLQYVEQTEFEASGYAEAVEVPAPPAEPFDLGDGEEMKELSAGISSLEADTAYRYRLVVTNHCKPEPAPLCDFSEGEGSFRTFPAPAPSDECPNDRFRAEGSGGYLPDCRGYEMVSPVDKNGANVEGLSDVSGFDAALDQAALDGGSISYSAYKAFAGAASAPYTSQYLARRNPGSGWGSESISPPREGAALMTLSSAQLDRQYFAFSPDLCSGWVVQDANPTLAPEAIEGYPGLYRRDNCGAGGYEALTVLQLPATEPPNLPPRRFVPEMEGASEDGSRTIFTVSDNLTSDAPPQPLACEEDVGQEPCLSRLYAAEGGVLEYICILPDGSPYAGSCVAGTPNDKPGRFNSLQNAISDDGSRVFWSASGAGPGKLYVRIDGTETKLVSSASAQFWAASQDGSRAVYSVGEQLFEFDVETEEESLIAGKFKGVAGVSDDGARVYFASTQVLTGGANSEGATAQPGGLNLYRYEVGAGFDFVATLADADLTSKANLTSSPLEKRPVAHLARVNSSGEQLVFMSQASITGYDNRDAVTGEPNMEVFLYDAAAGGGEGAVRCISCNPSNARSRGRLLTQKLLVGRRAAARIPTYVSQLYGSRVVSEDGSRVYFNSYEALVSRDVNGEEDVYQWEAPGSGGCTTGSATFQEASEGCVDLISSGQGAQGSEFVDSSGDGHDVFFKTYDSLVGQDPNRLDIYDARVGGGFAGPAASPSVCQGEACRQLPTSAPAAPGAGSAAAGPGNPAWPPAKAKPRKCPKGKHKVKAKGKVRCVKNRKAKKTRRAGR